MTWIEKKLSEVVDLRRGFDLPGHARQDGPYPVLTAGSVAGRHAVGPVKGPGLAIGRATNLGRPTWSDSDYWPLNTTLYAADFYGNEPRWVFHLFEILDLSGYDSGSVQPMLNRNYISHIPVKVPPRPEQQAIAQVMRAVDDKLAVNAKKALLLDELAVALFKQQSPSAYAHDLTFADVASIGGGGTPSSQVSEYWGGDIAWATPTDVTRLQGPYLFDTDRTITDEGLANCSSSLYPPNTILMTSRATIGAFALTTAPTAVNQGFIVASPNQEKVPLYWLFHDLRSRTHEFLGIANGATFLELSRGAFKNLRPRLERNFVMWKFNEVAASLHECARATLHQSRTLKSMRHFLLPALMSGRLRVRDVEKLVEDAT